MESKEDPYLALLAVNNTPGENGNSPAQILFNRVVHTLVPSVVTNIKSCKQTKKNHQKFPSIQSIQPGSTVRVRYDTDKSWLKKGVVLDKRTEPRSFDILNEKGNVIRVNQRHLLPCKDKFSIKNDSGDDISLHEDKIESSTEVPKVNDNYTNNEQTDIENLTSQSNDENHMSKSNDENNIENSSPNKTVTTRSGRTIQKPLRYR